MAITLAPAALERVKGYLASDPGALGLRFGVRRTGCSGWGYSVDLAHAEEPGDTVFEQDGVRIFVDADSLELVDGTEMDFLKQGRTSSSPSATRRRPPNAAAAKASPPTPTRSPDPLWLLLWEPL